ncbi:MAG: helix-turn-helix domain-containing protein [Dermatophilaceae bacterium]
MSPLVFRNVDADPADPVETWPYEALVAAIERGTIGAWVRVTSAIDREPWGDVARQVEEYLAYAAPKGVGPLLARAVERARAQAGARERGEVAAEMARLVDATGLPLAEVARRIGTSRSRLSTYRSGRVVPSAALIVRLRHLVDRLADQAARDEPRP